MAFGLATEDDDAESLTVKESKAPQKTEAPETGKVKAELLKVMSANKVTTDALCKVYNVQSIDDMTPNAMQNAIKNIDKIQKKAEEMK